jgi:hypothetical protein
VAAHLEKSPRFSIQGYFKRGAGIRGKARKLLAEGLRKAGFPERPPLKLPK